MSIFKYLKIKDSKKKMQESTKKRLEIFCLYRNLFYLCNAKLKNAGIAQLVEHNLAKVGVASPSLVSRSFFEIMLPRWRNR